MWGSPQKLQLKPIIVNKYYNNNNFLHREGIAIVVLRGLLCGLHSFTCVPVIHLPLEMYCYVCSENRTETTKNIFVDSAAGFPVSTVQKPRGEWGKRRHKTRGAPLLYIETQGPSRQSSIHFHSCIRAGQQLHRSRDHIPT